MPRHALPAVVLALAAVCGACGRSSGGVRASVRDSAGVSVVHLLNLPAVEEPSTTWTLDLVRSVATDDGYPSTPPVLFDPREVVRMPEGSLVVNDGGPMRLAVVDADKDSVIARFAPTGQGPKELNSADLWMSPVSDSSFRVIDASNKKIMTYSLQGAVLGTDPFVSGESEWWMWLEMPERSHWVYADIAYFEGGDPGGKALSEDSVAVIYPVGAGPGAVPKVPMFPAKKDPNRRPGQITLLEPRTVFTVLGDGDVVTGRTDLPVVRIYAPTGSLTVELVLPLNVRELSDLERRDVAKDFGSVVAPIPGMSAPTVSREAPLYVLLRAVGDTVFALEQSSRFSPAEDQGHKGRGRYWRLFTASGGYAGSVDLPPDFTVGRVADGRVVGVQRDSLGVATLREYVLRPPRG